jgi:protein-tyrosine phosphatase
MKDRLIFSLKVVKKLLQNWGLNRISIVTALVLMRDGWSAEDAIELNREKRPGALFNQNFVKFLHAQERLTKAS